MEQLNIGNSIAANWFRGIQLPGISIKTGFIQGLLYVALQKMKSEKDLELLQQLINDLNDATEKNVVDTMNDILFKLHQNNLLFL
ncbi:MAG: hypothetical protein HUJ63_06005 [Enterococcus sp.]|nr:hypothetical protein [Enterococcus sp.]